MIEIFAVLIMNSCCHFDQCIIQDTIPTKHKQSEEVPLFGITFKRNADSILKVYADSINSYKKGILPSFLLNECFDYYRYLWKGIHSPVSLRWKILKKVHSKKALKLILDSQDMELKKVCDYPIEPYPNIRVPMIEKSFYELLKKRYLQIKNSGP